jgi:hypothetical protein
MPLPPATMPPVRAMPSRRRPFTASSAKPPWRRPPRPAFPPRCC